MSNFTEAILGFISASSASDLELLKRELVSFPRARDPVYGDYWLFLVVERGYVVATKWMLTEGVDVNQRDDGYTTLHWCIESTVSNKSDMLALLLEYGAAINAKALNDWTPLHLAAARNDVASVERLMLAGADPSIRTTVDGRSTPAEEAEMLGAFQAAQAIREFRSS